MKTSLCLCLSFSLVTVAACIPPEQDPATAQDAWNRAAAKQAAQIEAQNAVYTAKNDEGILATYEKLANDVEADLIKSCQATLGVIATEGTDGKHIGKASARIAELRRAGIKIVIERVPSKNAGPPMYELRDDVMMNPEAARTLTETRSPALMREFQRRQPYTYKLLDLSQQSRQASMAAFMANLRLATMNAALAPMLAHQIRAMQAQGRSLDADGRAQLRRQMAVYKKFQILVAAATGAFASYEAAAAGRDPRAIDAVAEATLKVLPLKGPPQVSDEELDVALQKVPAELEAERAKHDELMKKVFVTAPTAPPPATAPAERTVAADARQAKVVEPKGGMSSALDLTGLPKDGILRSSIEGADALVRGDYKTALLAAVSLVPIGGGLLKDGLALALSLVKS